MPSAAQRSHPDGKRAGSCLRLVRSLDGVMKNTYRALLSALVFVGLCGCEGGAPSHMGDAKPSEQVKAQLENVGHAVEDGAGTLKAALEGVGESVQQAGDQLSATVDSLKAPAAASAPARGGPRIYEAPARR